MRARTPGVALVAPALVVLGLAGGSLLASGDRPTPGRATAGTPSPRQPQATARPVGARPGASVVANARGAEALIYSRPGAARPWRRYTNPTPERTPLVFLVRRREGGWLRVLLPSRPNGSEGWLRADAVWLRANPYSVVVSLGSHSLIVRRYAREVLRARVGVGRAATPTPAGLYYVTELLRQPDPGGAYGPWAFALSAFSPVLTRFGAGAGQVGLHGTDHPSGIGHTVSHGCLRVRNALIERLARLLPLGTPVRILAPAATRAHEFTGT